MLRAMGLTKIIWDWRDEHVDTFDAELDALRQNHIELSGIWTPSPMPAFEEPDYASRFGVVASRIKTLITEAARRGHTPDLWTQIAFGGPGTPTPLSEQVHRAEVMRAADHLTGLVRLARGHGMCVVLTNHGGWAGEPLTLVDVVSELARRGLGNVGIGFRLQHAHHLIADLDLHLATMSEHLVAVMLSGADAGAELTGRVILPFGAGSRDRWVTHALLESGWQGQLVVHAVGHDDSEARLLDSLEGWEWAVDRFLRHPRQRPVPRILEPTWPPGASWAARSAAATTRNPTPWHESIASQMATAGPLPSNRTPTPYGQIAPARQEHVSVDAAAFFSAAWSAARSQTLEARAVVAHAPVAQPIAPPVATPIAQAPLPYKPLAYAPTPRLVPTAPPIATPIATPIAQAPLPYKPLAYAPTPPVVPTAPPVARAPIAQAPLPYKPLAYAPTPPVVPTAPPIAPPVAPPVARPEAAPAVPAAPLSSLRSPLTSTASGVPLERETLGTRSGWTSRSAQPLDGLSRRERRVLHDQHESATRQASKVARDQQRAASREPERIGHSDVRAIAPDPYSGALHALLLHLEEVGFTGAPRSFGWDDKGRHLVEYVPGTRADSLDAPERALEPRRIGEFLRDMHDALDSFVPPDYSRWFDGIPSPGRELIVHQDIAPSNIVLRADGSLVAIDWDAAGPGTRLWDLAHACHAFAPLYRAGADVSNSSERLRLLVDGYGLDDAQRAELVPLLAMRSQRMYEYLDQMRVTGRSPWVELWQRGVGAVWKSDAQWIRDNAATWRWALLG